MVKRESRSPILDALRERALLLDGATGTLLQQRGLPEGYPPHLWNIESPEAVLAAHREYVAAGADILTTNTFGASRTRLLADGAAERIALVNRAGVDLARRAAGSRAWVAGGLGPLPDLLPADRRFGSFLEQAGILVSAGVDLLAIETMLDLSEMRAAVLACNEVRGATPLMASMTFTDEDCGCGPAIAAAMLEELGVDIIGANCMTAPEPMTRVSTAMARVTRLPIAAQPSAGLPVRQGPPVYSMTPAQMAESVPALLEAGASLVGGCCGTTPEFIRMAAARLAGRSASRRLSTPAPGTAAR